MGHNVVQYKDVCLFSSFFSLLLVIRMDEEILMKLLTHESSLDDVMYRNRYRWPILHIS